MIEQSASVWLTVEDKETTFILYADDLVILSPTEQGLQQSLSLLKQYCEEWPLSINIDKTKVMIFQKKSKSQESR